MTSDSENPYAVRKEIPITRGEAVELSQIVGRTRSQLTQEEREALQAVPRLNRFLAFFVIVFFAYVIWQLEIDLLFRIVFAVLVSLVPLLYWVTRWFYASSLKGKVARMDGADIRPIEMQALKDGFRLSSDGLEQFSLWGLIQGQAVVGKSWIFMGPNVVYRQGLILDIEEEPAELKRWDDLVRSLRIAPANLKVYNKIVHPSDAKHVHLQGLLFQVEGKIRSRDMIGEDPQDWKWLQAYFLSSMLLGMVIILLMTMVVGTLLKSLTIPLMLFLLGTSFLGVKAFRGLRVLFRGNAIVSDLIVTFYENGCERRTNATHSRSLWSAYEAPVQTELHLMVKLRFGSHTQRLLSRSWFQKDEEWSKACSIATAKILSASEK